MIDVIYTRDVYDMKDHSANYPCFIVENPSKIIINGVMSDYEDKERIMVGINVLFDIEDYKLFIIQVSNNPDSVEFAHTLSKAICIRYDKYNRYLFIDPVGAYSGGDR